MPENEGLTGGTYMADTTAHEIDSGVVADRIDDRDAEYVPDTSTPLPEQFELAGYRDFADETWHQRGEECTGFALAAIANFLIRRSEGDPLAPSVSRRMLYEMAQRYDGEMHVEGSTLRGALKGWNRVGVAADEQWPYHPDDEHGDVHGTLTLARILDARKRPLLNYRRIVGEDIEKMQRVLVEGRPLYVAARTHVGWYRLFLSNTDPLVERRTEDAPRGIHSFVVMGYDERGFQIHNSWGPEWGTDGYALLPYEQWRWGATDAWVVDAGIEPATDTSPAVRPEPDPAEARRVYRDMWQHLVVLRDDGRLAATGLYEMDEGSVKTMLYLFDEYTKANQWSQRKLAVIADGGAVSTATTIERMRPLRDKLLAAGVYPLFIVWETPWFAELDHEVRTWIEHGDWPDDADPRVVIRAAAALSRGHAALRAIADRSNQAVFGRLGGARMLVGAIAYKRGQRDFDLYTISFGAGDLLAGPLATLLPAPVSGGVAVAPPTTAAQFASTTGDMLADGCMQHLTLVSLEEQAEHADRFGGSPASVLELISEVWALRGRSMRQGAREARRSGTWSVNPIPLLGLTRHLGGNRIIDSLAQADRLTLRTIADVGHLDLPVSPEVHDLLIEQMTAHSSPTPSSPTPSSPAQSSPAQSSPAQSSPTTSSPTTGPAINLLPRDPLAAAELRRSMRQA